MVQTTAVNGPLDEKHMVSILTVIELNRDALQTFLGEMSAVMAENFRYYEIIILDNGSTDGSAEILEGVLEEASNVRWIRLARRKSFEIALAAGLEHCIGDFVVVIDSKIDPPAEVPRLVDAVRHRHDVAIAKRAAVQEKRSWLLQVLNSVSKRLLRHPIDTDVTYFRAMRRNVVVALNQIKNRRRYLGYFHTLIGFKHTEIPVASHQGLIKNPRILRGVVTLLDVAISNSAIPLRCATYLSLLGASGSFLYLLYVVLVALLKSHVVEGWVTTAFILTSMFLCMFTVLALLSEYIARILEETQERPLYFIELDRTSSGGHMRTWERLNVI